MLPNLQFATVFYLYCAANALAYTIGKTGTLTLTSQVIGPDGFNRTASVINGVHPGPLIAVNKGDSVSLNVVNNLSDPDMILGTTIHWHGMFQTRTNFMDGTDGVTQCPIAPGDSFRYTFKTGEQSGTYWYHSHFGVQYCDGVRGGFVIYDDEDPHRSMYDASTIIALSEWYHTLAVDITGIAEADSTLINGKGRYPGGPQVDLSIINVMKGKRYRFRIISISCDPNFVFSIDNHDLTIIETEGTSTKPYTVNSIQILAGQRYSVVLNANQTIGNYWIRALPNSGNRNLSSTFEGGVNSAILRYLGAPIQEPTSTQQTHIVPLVESHLHPEVNRRAPGRNTPNGGDIDFVFNFGFDLDSFSFNINGTSFQPPSVPVLLQILSGTQPPQNLLPEGSVYTVERNKTVQLNLPSGLIGGPHPFHLHGHEFWVVRSADTNAYNYQNPIIRDTVNVGDTVGDFVSIRFRTDNPGPWILHCHIDFHLVTGLAIVFAEAPEDTKAYLKTPPAEWDQLCQTWNNLPETITRAGQN
uniref:laccase n=1 Tax=Leucoagaricus gongylophorus TaxID=79220 RepID=K9MEL4_LEUGO|nr:laccase [Leucoagaricus gongylophorus]